VEVVSGAVWRYDGPEAIRPPMDAVWPGPSRTGWGRALVALVGLLVWGRAVASDGPLFYYRESST
jgi:hypothetical protein